MNQENIKSELQNHTKRIKKEPKTRKRTRKTTRQLKVEEEEGTNVILCGNLKLLTQKISFSDDIKEEEMEIAALEYDNDDFANDPSFTITSILDDKELADDELNDIFANADADADDDEDDDEDNSDSDLDESQNTSRKRRRKSQVPDNKTYK